MSNFAALIATIQANIKTNGNEEITGAVLQDVLKAMVQALGTEAINNLETALGNEVGNRQDADGTLQNNIDAEALRAGTAEGVLQTAINGIKSNIDNGYVYAGIATPSGTPASGKVFYLAVTAGTYTNFGGLVVTQGINILKYNGTAWSQEQLIALDNTPTPSSSGLVKSGGVFEEIMTNGSAFDLTVHNSGTTYADLSAALTAMDSLPAAYKKGGMSIKFVRTSDNKYVQYRLMTYTFNTTPANWQGVDDEPTSGSDNFVNSGGVVKYNAQKFYIIDFTKQATLITSANMYRSIPFKWDNRNVNVRIDQSGNNDNEYVVMLHQFDEDGSMLPLGKIWTPKCYWECPVDNAKTFMVCVSKRVKSTGAYTSISADDLQYFDVYLNYSTENESVQTGIQFSGSAVYNTSYVVKNAQIVNGNGQYYGTPKDITIQYNQDKAWLLSSNEDTYTPYLSKWLRGVGAQTPNWYVVEVNLWADLLYVDERDILLVGRSNSGIGILNTDFSIKRNNFVNNTGYNKLYGKKINWLGDSLTAEGNITNAVANRTGLIINNYGISGTKIAGLPSSTDCMAVRYADMGDDCDAIFVLGGVNDWGSTALGDVTKYDNFGYFYGALHTLFGGLRRKYPTKPILCATTPHAQYPGGTEGGVTYPAKPEYIVEDGLITTWPSSSTSLEKYNDAIREVAQIYSIPCIDLYRESGYCPFIESNKTLYTRDGLHPNVNGGHLLADMLIPFFTKYLLK